MLSRASGSLEGCGAVTALRLPQLLNTPETFGIWGRLNKSYRGRDFTLVQYFTLVKSNLSCREKREICDCVVGPQVGTFN